MGETKNPLEGITFKTEGVPVLYANQASPAISFNDIRIYFSEVGPKELQAVVSTEPMRIEPTVMPRICIVASPEFAKDLANSLLLAVQKYEGIFGPLRPQTSFEDIQKKLNS